MRNLVVQVKKSGKICDRDGCYPMSSGLTKTRNNSYPQTMHDLVQASNYDSTILESFGMYQGVEALQRPLLVMSRPRDSSKPAEPH